jgi:hypothetical protein
MREKGQEGLSGSGSHAPSRIILSSYKQLLVIAFDPSASLVKEGEKGEKLGKSQGRRDANFWWVPRLA